MATYAIGDIQGCFESFSRLLAEIGFSPSRDRLWLTGDLVNRGPRSLETLRYVKSLGASAITVLGNHDLSMLLASQGLGKKSRGDTFDEVLNASDAQVLLGWLREQPLCYLEDDYCMVHAGLLPQWSVARACALAAEFEAELQAKHWKNFLVGLWGSEPRAWSESLTGVARYRVIVNAMTRLRFCTVDGVMEFETKLGAAHAPEGFMPWFEVANRESASSIMIMGHWSALGLKVEPNLLALDTGCVWGGCLTAVRLEDRTVIQVDCSQDESQALQK